MKNTTLMITFTLFVVAQLGGCAAMKRSAAYVTLVSKDEKARMRDAEALVDLQVFVDALRYHKDGLEAEANDLARSSASTMASSSSYQKSLLHYGEKIRESTQVEDIVVTSLRKKARFFEENDVTYLIETQGQAFDRYPDSLLSRARSLVDSLAVISDRLRRDRIDLIAAWDSTHITMIEERLAKVDMTRFDRSELEALSLTEIIAVRDSARGYSQESPVDLLTNRLEGWKVSWSPRDDHALAERSPRSTPSAIEKLATRWDEAVEPAASNYVLANAVLGERIKPFRERRDQLKEHPRTVSTGTALLSGPARGTAPVADLNEGMEVYKLDAREGWVKIGIEPSRLDYTACDSPRDVDAQFTQGWVPASALELPRDWTYYRREDRLHSSAINDPAVRLCLTRIYDKLVVNLESLQHTCNAALMAHARNEPMMVTWQVDDGQTYTSRWTWFDGVSIGGSAALCMTDPKQFILLNGYLAAGRKISFRIEGAFGGCQLQFSCMGFRRAADIAFENWGVDPSNAR